VGIRSVFDSSPRNPENRMSTYLIISKGKAYDLLNAKPKFERFPSEVIRELAKSGSMIDINMKDVGVALNAPGSDPVIVYMATKQSAKSEKPSKEIEIKGYAQFRGDKMIGTFEGNEAHGFSWLRNESVHTPVSLMYGGTSREGVYVRMHEVRTRIKPDIGNETLKFHIDVQAKAVLLEDEKYLDLSQEKNVEKIESILNQHIKKSMNQVIKKCIARNVDSVQLGTYVWRSFPDQWKKTYSQDWPRAMKEAEFDINVKSTLIETGLIYENVTKGRTLK